MDAFFLTLASSPAQALEPALTGIAKHLRARKKGDDDAARKMKDAILVEYTSQSEEHEKGVYEFVDAVQRGLGELGMSLVAISHIHTQNKKTSADQDTGMKNPDPDLDLARAFAGEVNNFMLGHLKHYQKLLKKGKLNARQRTEKFGRGSLVHYNESLVTDEKGLLVFFKQLKELFEQVATRKRLSERRLEEDADVKIEPGTGSENIRTFGCESDGLNVSASRAGERGRKRRRGAEGERVGHVVGDLTEKKRKLDDKRKARCK